MAEEGDGATQDAPRGITEEHYGDVERGRDAPAATPGARQETDFSKMSNDAALKSLNATERGLSEAEAAHRTEQHGYNEIPEASRNPVLVYLGYLWNPLAWAMEAAAILAIILLDYADFCLIIALLFLNATISYVEEASADRAIKALTQALAPKARVKRDGQVRTLPARELVPGDVVVVQFGNIVPADIKLLGKASADEVPLQIDQAALTGESLPVKKHSGDVAFSGSTVKQGEREALVYATGQNTFFGRAAALISSTHSVANLQRVMTHIGAVCLITIGVWCAIEVPVQFAHYHHDCKIGEEGCPTLTNLLVVIVGGIPIAMPTVLSVTLALGANELAKEGAIVARMSAVEEMAGMDILCSDKTGTLTLNQLTVDRDSALVMPGHDLNVALMYAALSANIQSEEPIDVVLHESYPGKDTLWDEWEREAFVPFNPTDKYTIATVRNKASGQRKRIMKGAPQVVLNHARNAAEIGDQVREKIREFAQRGLRALGVAITDDVTKPVGEAEWEFVVLLPLFDPPRHDTRETIQRCIERGVQVKMVTGDQLLIAKETARQLGMGTNILTTEALLEEKDGTGDAHERSADVARLVEKADGFAEVFPEHKFKVVELLQSRGHIVAMTGDGVNDAPALKKADVGIAVDGATDAARGAADIVLTQPGLSTITSAIIGARKIFQRMATYAKYTVAMTFRICFTFGLLTVIYNWYFPTLLIVLLAVFNDGAMIALSTDRVREAPVPCRWVLGTIFLEGLVYGLYLTLSSWVLFHVATDTTFFTHMHLADLTTTGDRLRGYCLKAFHATDAPLASIPSYAAQFPGKHANTASLTVMQQCMAEQHYVRDSITRSLMYNEVSISGQAVVFVVRTSGWSYVSRAGLGTYVAFLGAQVASTLIAGLGFGGYTHPRHSWSFWNGQFTRLSNGHAPAFLPSNHNWVPIAGSEGQYEASAIGCTYYVIVAWIWAFAWSLGLDPIKWAMMVLLNEAGWRDRLISYIRSRGRKGAAENSPTQAQRPAELEQSSKAVSTTHSSVAHPTPVPSHHSEEMRSCSDSSNDPILQPNDIEAPSRADDAAPDKDDSDCSITDDW